MHIRVSAAACLTVKWNVTLYVVQQRIVFMPYCLRLMAASVGRLDSRGVSRGKIMLTISIKFIAALAGEDDTPRRGDAI